MNKYKGGAQFTIWQRPANFSVVDLVEVAALLEAAGILVSSYGVPDFGVYYPGSLVRRHVTIGSKLFKSYVRIHRLPGRTTHVAPTEQLHHG